jgi:hypothetical protein
MTAAAAGGGAAAEIIPPAVATIAKQQAATRLRQLMDVLSIELASRPTGLAPH